MADENAHVTFDSEGTRFQGVQEAAAHTNTVMYQECNGNVPKITSNITSKLHM